jgi:hypothetical protein
VSCLHEAWRTFIYTKRVASVLNYKIQKTIFCHMFWSRLRPYFMPSTVGTYDWTTLIIDDLVFTGFTEVTSLEYTRLSVSHDILFRYNISMNRCENKYHSYLRNIKTGSNCFFDVSYTIYPRFLIGNLSGRVPYV